MDEEVFETAKEQDLSLEEAEELQDIVDTTCLEPEEALKAKELAEELDIDIEDAAELQDLL